MKLILTATLLAMTVGLSACGGSDSGDAVVAPPAPTPTPTPVPTAGFSKTAVWEASVDPKLGELCYDIDAQAAADCKGDAWDLKVKDDGRSTGFFTNSGTSGAAKGGALGSPFDSTWADLKKWQDGMKDPVSGALDVSSYLKDYADGVFTGTNAIKSAAFEYDLAGDHKLSPNFKVFLISDDASKADAKQYALQVVGYYGGNGGTASGYPSIRWVDRASNNERTASFDASKAWVYFDLAKGAESTEAGTWHVAFNRYSMKLNSGASGAGTVAALLAKTPEGFYTADGKPVTAKFADTNNLAQTRALLTATDLLPAKAKWLSDKNTSPLNPAMKGNYPEPMDAGWYNYYSTLDSAKLAGLAAAHMLKANPTAATMIRSAEGNSFARMHLTEIKYADPSKASSAKTWKFEFDIQPKL
ncbi:HmuY family protein [Iodobacter sp.]|uniref:HmuY family protein n=1 Tax=Iodobacter sp. TaxID=1915058 RepID=UPI0025E24999|nr:HmuY family protein [Iodobacter sp.]